MTNELAIKICDTIKGYYRVFFSSYEISDKRFNDVWQKEKSVTLCATDNSRKAIEHIYCNKPYYVPESKEKPIEPYFGPLFN